MENVFEILKTEYPQLIVKLDENHDVCTFLMGAYAHILQLAQSSLGDPRDIWVYPTIMAERKLVLHITMGKVSAERADVGDKLPRQRNLNLVKFLQVNRSVRDLALNVAYILESWVENTSWVKETNCKFKDIRTFNSVLWREDPPKISTELIVHKQFDEYVENKMGWDKKEEEPKVITEGSDLIQ